MRRSPSLAVTARGAAESLSTGAFIVALAWWHLGLAHAQDGPQVNAQIDTGFRYYFDDGVFSGQQGAGMQIFAGAEIDATAPFAGGTAVLEFSFLQDKSSGRETTNLRQANVQWSLDGWDLLVGYNIENWGVAQSRSIFDVVNPFDGRGSGLEGVSKGTPMIRADVFTPIGTFSGYALVGFVEPAPPDGGARHRSIWRRSGLSSKFEESNKGKLDFALRFENNYTIAGGGLDIAAHYFDGTSREPVIAPDCSGGGDIVLRTICASLDGGWGSFWEYLGTNATDELIHGVSQNPVVVATPYYRKIQQFGFSSIYARGDLQLRFEGLYQKSPGESGFFAAVAGGDYTWQGFAGGPGQLTLAAEYHFDDRPPSQPIAILENDAFLGVNFLFNDMRDTQMNFGGFYDLSSHAQLYSLSVSTRLTDSLRAEATASKVFTDGWNDPLASIGHDTFFEFRLSSYF